MQVDITRIMIYPILTGDAAKNAVALGWWEGLATIGGAPSGFEQRR